MMKRRTTLFLTALLLLALLSGCSSDDMGYQRYSKEDGGKEMLLWDNGFDTAAPEERASITEG